MIKIIFFISFLLFTLNASCLIPNNLKGTVKKLSFETKDLIRNKESLKNICLYEVNIRERKYNWKMVLAVNPKKEKSTFWFIPHDDENSAFDSAVYAIKKYGGGFLAIVSNDKRYFKGQDPNRNFGTNWKTAKRCKRQRYPAPKYTKTIFKIIDTYKYKNFPYIALHNNKNGWYGNGGAGGVSILNSSKYVKSYKAYKKINRSKLSDEDTLIYIAGKSKYPNKKKLRKLLKNKINVKYERVTQKRNDCSMSNYIVLSKKTTNYFNIETQKGDTQTQKELIDKIINSL